MRTATTSALAMASALLCAAPALAQAPVALVREVHGAAVGVELMDYVAAGKVIRLGPQESVVLEYLKSCRRERIRGGVVTVGAEQSEVQGGEVTRNAIPCSAGNIKLTREQANQSAGVPIRSAPTPAPGPAALVEEVRGTTAGVAFMDYVATGKVIRLGPQESIVLGYLGSCWHETIKGGIVTVGAEQSEVQGGEVSRRKVMCNGGKIALTPRQANQSAGTTVRALHAKPALTLYGLFPVVEADGGTLTIVRVDREGEYHVANVPVKRGTRRSFFDFATTKRALAAGGTYRANIGSRRILFLIDPNATARDVPIISRLLRFPPAS